MARKWLKKRLAKPSDSDPPTGSSENAAGNVTPASATSGNASRGPFPRARNLLHPTRLLLGQGSLGPTAESNLDSVVVGTQVDAARLGMEAITPVSRMGGAAINRLAQADSADTNLQSLINNYVRPLKLFNSVVTKIANIHPYAQVALGILTAAANLIISQANLDSAVSGLLEKVGFVYELLLEEDTLKHIDDMRDTLAKIARVVSDAAQFVTNYTKTQSFWKRLGLNVLRETQLTVDGYTQSLDSLMQQFRDRAVRDIQINLYRVQEDQRLDGMTYAAGAGLDKTKRCLDGTRTKILQEIIHWATCGDANSPRILWLHGQAGRGKSAIAHTIASWIKDVGGLGSCFCFARDRQAEHREQKIFATIARGVADRDLAFRRALADAVSVDYDLKTTCDVIQQWQQLILEPLFKVHGSMVGNVVVVIDALDESGPEVSRRHILSLLASTEAANLPENFRILLTSRPLPDIEHALGACPHVRPTSLDNIPAEFVEHDIKLYVSKQLSHLAEIGEAEVQTIVQKSNGLFEWARLACEFVKPNKPGRTIRERFDDIAFCRFGSGGTLLDAMYKTILDDIIPNDDITDISLTRFQSVMWQIMSTFEPLRMDTLNKMRARFPREDDHFDMIIILEFMSPLLGGIVDRNTVVRPLHASFYDFLADPARSGIYCVCASDMHTLAFASLNILHGDLCFNICGLESSHLCNSEVPDLPERINKSISPHLSYSCKFWAQHLGRRFNSALAALVKVVFQSERFLFWLEALSLLDACGGAPDSLLKVTAWLQGQEGVEDSLVLAQDGIKFIQHFGNIISCSAPHLYISALPFAPSNTPLSKLIMPKFTGLVGISVGGHKEWPVIQLALQGHTSGVSTSAVSCDGKKIVSGSYDKTVRIWDAEQGAQIGDPFQGHTGGVNSVGCSPDGKRIVSGSSDNTVRVWDAEGGVQIGDPLQGHTGRVWSVGFSPDGKRIVSGSDDGTVRIWDAEQGAQIGDPLQGHTGGVLSVRFSLDGKRIVSGSSDKTVRIWDAERGVQIGDPLQGHTGGVWSVGFSPDGKRIISGSSDKTVRMWDSERGVQSDDPLKGHTGWVNSVGFSPDGKRIVSGSDDNTVRVWDAEGGVQIGDPLQGHTGGVLSVGFSPDGKRIVSGSSDKTVRIWDHAERGVQNGDPLKGHTGGVWSVGFSPDGKRVVSGSFDQTVRIWDAEQGTQIGDPLQGHTRGVLSVGCSPDGKKIVSCSFDKTVRIWGAEQGVQIGDPLQGHTDWVNSVEFSPDGKRIISGSHDKTVRVWDAERGVQIGDPLQGHTGGVLSVGFSPDGRRIVSGSEDNTVRMWDAERGVQIGDPLQGHTGWVNSVKFSPDGKRIVSGSHDNTVRIWDAERGAQIGDPLQGHTGWVNSVGFSPDGKRIVSGSEDNTVRVWDAENSAQIGIPIQGPIGIIYSATFSPDGLKVALGSEDSSARVLDVQNFEGMVNTFREFTSSACHSVSVPLPSTGAPPICFSFASSHPLQDAQQLLSGLLQEDASTWGDPVRLHPDGWIKGPKGRLLLWIPPTFWRPFYSIWTISVMPRGCCIELNLSQMVHGDKWHQCFRAV